ncbi:S8 family serine peptidase [Saccharothrix sp. NRRL B-16314]|uniref:S8 family serine peptidase n=1 Tax=Saccharothrix sp. NRRL B-16314 TaxID=1463825 RepID=UPI000526D669|nr:S8 family serine peptidase [Saccharothrix sp. NRRL B-16314]
MRRSTTAVVTMVAAAVVGTISTPPVDAAAETPPTGLGTVNHRWLTLVTGDRVLLDGPAGDEQVVQVIAGEGRSGITFTRDVGPGAVHVIPSDAAPLVAAGRVDKRLFDVSLLAGAGYDDANRTTVPLVVTHAPGTRTSVAAAREEVHLPSLGATAVEVAKAETSLFWGSVTGANPQTLAAGVTEVWLDGPVRPSLDRSVPQIGAPSAWAAGLTGAGATVAVLDTGVDAAHPDLADAVVGAQDFTGSGAGDRIGHGTHVAGIVTGNGAASGGRHRGVAPDAKLFDGKVIADDGQGQESWVIAGMEWAVAQHADVVNVSLGSGRPGDGTDPMSQAVDRLTEETGTLFVVAAGNSGPFEQSVESPGAADAALTVGAVDRDDTLATFSGRGPRTGDNAVKPDITAPGVGIVAPLADGSELVGQHPVVDGRYVALSGTSMATPHVAGAAALLAGGHAEWDADELKPVLMGSATPKDGLSVHEQGAGRVDVARAVAQQVHATPASIGHGVVPWPHDDDRPLPTTLTYRNTGTEQVALDLSVDVRGPDGAPVPAGVFTLDRTAVTVPAGGSVAVVLTADTSVPAPPGAYEGRVVATGGPTTVRTPLAVTLEPESYDVTLTVLDRAGNPTPDYFVRFVDLAVQAEVVPYHESGTAVARLPAGTHFLDALITSFEGTWNHSLVVEPTFVVDRDATVVLDAREARPVGVELDEPDAATARGEVSSLRTAEWGPTGFIVSGNPDRMYVRPSTTSAPSGQFTSSVQVEAARPDGAGGFTGSPYLYHVKWSEDGRVPADLVRRVGDGELATEHTRIAASAPGQWASKDFLVDLETPATLTERYSPGVAWSPALYLYGTPPPPTPGVHRFPLARIAGAPVTFQPGEHRVQRWNTGVFGPAFADDPVLQARGPHVRRTGDTIDYNLWLFTDQGAAHSGIAYQQTGPTRLFRDGQPVGTSGTAGSFTVPAGESTYRLEADHAQTVATVSTDVTAAWTFRSGHVAGTAPAALPLMAVRFAPDLDEHNQAKSGRLFTVPVSVQRQAGASFGTLRPLSVQVSYDDGGTWRPATTTGWGSWQAVVLFHPPGPGSVSLKAVASDSDGNAVEQTIIRAYTLTG